MQMFSVKCRLPWILLVTCLGALTCTRAALSETQLEQGYATPVTTLDGSTVRLAQIRSDKPVYIKFWASWCGTCLEELPHFQETWREYRDDIDFYYVNLGINDSLDYVRSFVIEHDLQMTVLIDSTGGLADTFGVMGTPWHTLADESSQLLMNTNATPAQIDTLLAFIVDPGKAAAGVHPRQTTAPHRDHGAADPEPGAGPALHYYLATWCDWYLEERRPETATRCVRSQRMVNRLVQSFPELEVRGFASRLWTDEDALADYLTRREVAHPVTIDSSNSAFLGREVREIPTLLLIDDGDVLYRETGFDDFATLENALRKALEKSGSTAK